MTFGSKTQELRERLCDGDDAARVEALGEIDRETAKNSARKWWALEGFTSVDCLLATDKLLLFIEGKRTDVLSRSTDWFPERNQLVRNLEAAGELAENRFAGVLVVTEDQAKEPLAFDMKLSAPHIVDPAMREQVSKRYLGQTTWSAVCASVDIPCDSLPRTSSEAIASIKRTGCAGIRQSD